MIDTIKKAKEAWIALGVIVLGVFSLLEYLNSEFQSVRAAERARQDITSQMTAVHEKQAAEMASIRALIELKIQQDNLSAVNLAIKNNDSETFQLHQWINVNGNDHNFAKRLKDLANEKDELIIRRQCIIRNNRACDR